MRLSDNSLQRMGIENNRDREAIWRRIVKQRLKTDMVELKMKLEKLEKLENL